MWTKSDVAKMNSNSMLEMQCDSDTLITLHNTTRKCQKGRRSPLRCESCCRRWVYRVMVLWLNSPACFVTALALDPSCQHTHMDRCVHAWAVWCESILNFSSSSHKCTHTWTDVHMHGISTRTLTHTQTRPYAWTDAYMGTVCMAWQIPSLSLSQTDRQTDKCLHAWHVNCHIYLKHRNKTKNKTKELSSFYTQKSMAVRLQNTSHTAWTNTVHGSTRVTHTYSQWKHTSHTHLRSDAHVTTVTETTGTILFCFTVGMGAGSTGVWSWNAKQTKNINNPHLKQQKL